jgi:HTH-type transcriptional regulator/antitoxin HipB
MQVNSTGALAAAVRGRRTDLGLSQAEVARRAGVSRAWVNEVEAGKPSLELGLVLRLVDVLGMRFELVTPGAADDPAPGRPVNLDSLLDSYRDRP